MPFKNYENDKSLRYKTPRANPEGISENFEADVQPLQAF